MNIIILILGLLSAFGPLTIDMYLPALPRIAEDFGVELSQVQLSLASYFVGLAIGQIFYGPITDALGRKKPLYIGLVIYGFASAGCALAPSVEVLILFRFLQAIGACSGMVISRAIVRDKYTANESARVFSLLLLIMGVAPILAPIIGGQMSEHWGWSSIFWTLTILSALTFACVLLFLPETYQGDSKLGFKETLKTYSRMFKDRNYLGYTISGGLIQSSLFAYITGSPFIFIKYFGVSTNTYSIIFGCNAFGLILFSQINGFLLKRISPQKLLKTVYPINACLGLVLIIFGTMNSNLMMVILGLFFYISMLGMIFPNSTACALESQGKNAGKASALMGTIQFTLSAITSGLISILHDGTLTPVLLVIGSCGVFAVLIYKMTISHKVSFSGMS